MIPTIWRLYQCYQRNECVSTSQQQRISSNTQLQQETSWTPEQGVLPLSESSRLRLFERLYPGFLSRTVSNESRGADDHHDEDGQVTRKASQELVEKKKSKKKMGGGGSSEEEEDDEGGEGGEGSRRRRAEPKEEYKYMDDEDVDHV